MFNDWNYMSFKDNLRNDIDYKLVSPNIWQKLIRAFGGAPEITYFLISKETTGSFQEPDLKPIKVQIQVIDASIYEETFGCRVSPFIGVKVFLNYIYPFTQIPPTKCCLFLYNPNEIDEKKLV